MTTLAIAGLAALKAWIKWRNAAEIHLIREARIDFDNAERVLCNEFIDSRLQSSNMSFGLWTVSIDHTTQTRDNGIENSQPLIMYIEKL